MLSWSFQFSHGKKRAAGWSKLVKSSLVVALVAQFGRCTRRDTTRNAAGVATGRLLTNWAGLASPSAGALSWAAGGWAGSTGVARRGAATAVPDRDKRAARRHVLKTRIIRGRAAVLRPATCRHPLARAERASGNSDRDSGDSVCSWLAGGKQEDDGGKAGGPGNSTDNVPTCS